MKESNKELLTKANIIIDLKNRFFRKTTGFLLTLILIPIGNLILVNLLILILDPNEQFNLVFSCIYYTIFSLIALYDLFEIIYGFISIHRKNFDIRSDWVVNKKTKRYNTRLNTPKPYTLVFAHNGKYGIPYGENYRWSNLHSATDKIIYDSTCLNDEFYLITINKQKIIMAYNKKHFNLE